MKPSLAPRFVAAAALLALVPLLGAQEPPAPSATSSPALGPSTASPDERSADEPAPPSTRYTIGLYLDVYGAWADTRPQDHAAFFPGAGVAGKRAEELALNLAAVDLRAQRGQLEAHVIAGAGNAMDVLHAGEPNGEGVGADVLQHLYKASLRWAPQPGLALEAGIFPSHIRFESALPRDNWNYTGSWAANYTPYYQTGVKASWDLAPGWNGEVHLLNGWQTVADLNDAKSIGLRLARSGPRGSLAVNGWIGPELAGDDHHERRLLDLVGSWSVSERLDVAAETYVGDQEIPGNGSRARWYAVVGYARLRLASRWSTALRIERFSDRDGGIVGNPQRFEALTLTVACELQPGLSLRLEGRHDRARFPVFQGAASDARERRQSLLLLAAMATF